MIQPEMVTAGVRIVRAEESWIPVLFGGMIPIVGAGGVFWLIWRAVRDNPENDLPPEERPSHPDYGRADLKKEGGPEDPPS
jgi:hypothetical protein